MSWLAVFIYLFYFFFSSRRRHTRCALVTGVQTCALPISVSLRPVSQQCQFCSMRGSAMAVHVERKDAVTTIILDRPAARNAVDRPTADALRQAFKDFDADDTARVAVLWGAGGHFCAGADLKAVADGDNRSEEHTSKLQSLM